MEQGSVKVILPGLVSYDRVVPSWIRDCPICGGADASVVLPLNATPLGDSLRTSRLDAEGAVKYSLSVSRCNACGHLYLPEVVEPDESYSEYHFQTTSSPDLTGVLGGVAEELWFRGSLKRGALVVDVGSNDGAWLAMFQQMGAEVLGVEPSPSHAQLANSSGVETLNAYLSDGLSEQIVETYGVPALITANFVSANVPDLQAFFGALKIMSGDQTLVSILTGYHPDQFRINMFDFVYHEHVSYFSARDFTHVASTFGWSVRSMKRVSLKGGSLHVILESTRSRAENSPEASRFLQYERWLGITEDLWFLDLRARIEREAARTRELMETVNGSRVIGYGMSHSVTTLAYNFPIADYVKALMDDNEMRHGYFAPGTGWQILNPSDALPKDVDAVVVLAWQHDYLIRKKLLEHGWTGPVIQPLPTARLTVGGD